MVNLGRLLLALVFVAGVSTPTAAQIYTWRDGNGTLILSDHPPAAATETRTFSVVRVASVRTTRTATGALREDYDRLIEHEATISGVRADLVRAVIQVESGFNSRARSTKGAMGLMQLMPATAAEFGVRNPYDAAENVRGGVAYLGKLLARYNQNEELALAAYNAGPDSVERYGNRVPPYQETREYVSRIKGTTPVTTNGLPPPRPIYRTVQIANGRQVIRYSDTRPTSSPYTVVELR